MASKNCKLSPCPKLNLQRLKVNLNHLMLLSSLLLLLFKVEVITAVRMLLILSNSERKPKSFRPDCDLNFDLCDTVAMGSNPIRA